MNVHKLKIFLSKRDGEAFIILDIPLSFRDCLKGIFSGRIEVSDVKVSDISMNGRQGVKLSGKADSGRRK